MRHGEREIGPREAVQPEPATLREQLLELDLLALTGSPSGLRGAGHSGIAPSRPTFRPGSRRLRPLRRT